MRSGRFRDHSAIRARRRTELPRPLEVDLRRGGVQVAVVNPLEAKYFAKSRLRRTKSDPADARTLAELGVRDQPPAREPLVGVEVREAARFCIRLVEGQTRGWQR